MSQDWTNFFLPTGSNWKVQALGSATTVTGEFAAALSIAGLAKCVIPLKIGT